MKLINIHFLIGISLLLFGCRENTTIQPEELKYEYTIPEDLNDGWITGSLQEVGLNSIRISEMMEFFNGFDNNIHGIIIVKNSKLVFEEYFKGYKYDYDNVPSEDDLIQFGPDTLHFLADVSKIIIPLMYGIASNDGFIFSFEDNLKVYLQEYSSIIIDGKENIKLRDLISMTSGIEWYENLFEYGNRQNDIQLLLNSDDPIKFFLEKNLSNIPGSRFDYNSGTTILLSEILKRITDVEIGEYAESNLFSPLGIMKIKWDTINDNIINTSGGLYLSLRDLAKLGELFAADGSWNGISVISQEWINFSKSKMVDLNYYFFSNGFGPHVWHYEFPINQRVYSCLFWAGWGEQYLFIIPELQIVFALTGGYYYDLVDFSIHTIIEKYLLSALEN